MARFANFFNNYPNINIEEALKKVNQSIQLDATVFNSFAFSVRGQIFLQDYTKQLTAWTKRNSSNQPKESLLKKAQNDLEKASEMHPTTMDSEDLAQVYYYIATDYHGNIKAGYDWQKYLQKALTLCARAAACKDGEKRPRLHKIRGQSLCALGEHQQSLKSFQRAIECKEYKHEVFESGNLLVVEYSHVLKEMGDTLSSNKPLLAEMVYWLHKAAELRLSNDQWTTYSMTPLTNLTSQWQSFVKFCEDNDYIRELDDIQEASLKPRQSRFQQRRTVSTSNAESLSREPPMRHSKSVTEEASGARSRIGYATASLSVLKLDDNETSSEAKEETSPMYLRTGKVQLSDQTSSSQEWTSIDASNKPIRAAPVNALHRDLTYDFFVIYSRSASEWVFRCLLEELEGRGLKGCIKDRDFMLGQTKVNNYTDSTANSSCVVIVITEDFEKDFWCDRGMLMAFEKRKLLIPILREDTELPDLLNPLTHLDATGAVDWMRLQRCIEQQIKLEAAA